MSAQGDQDACYCGELLPGKTCLVCKLREAESKLAAAEARAEQFKAAFEKYGQHNDCRAISLTTCQCGFLQRRARLAEIEKERSGQ